MKIHTEFINQVKADFNKYINFNRKYQHNAEYYVHFYNNLYIHMDATVRALTV